MAEEGTPPAARLEDGPQLSEDRSWRRSGAVERLLDCRGPARTLTTTYPAAAVASVRARDAA